MQIFYKRAEFFYSAAESVGHSGRKMLKRGGNTRAQSHGKNKHVDTKLFDSNMSLAKRI